MLFSSIEFLFLFLPVTLILGVILRRFAPTSVVVMAVLAANLFFYGWFRWSYLFILIGSIVVNYFVGVRLIRAPSRGLLLAGIVLNLALLGFYKYAFFFSSSLGFEVPALNGLVLPLAISFYTFQQISFIVDCNRRQIEDVEFFQYALYVSFFPQLIAGPIVRFSELYPQITANLFRADADLFARGLTLFVFGVAKKVLIADVLSDPVDELWGALGTSATVSSPDAWLAVFAYSFQIYFDFSAYSDMAIGLGFMMGLSLPVNFLSPYRATSIRDFWRRWHMTLSRWLRDYLYIALGGNRNGRVLQICAIFVTMALGGLWHGAGWNFVLWGVAHGLWIVASHLLSRSRLDLSGGGRLSRTIAACTTFLGVTALWIFFRGEQGAWIDMFGALSTFDGAGGVAVFEKYEIAVLLIAAAIAFFAPANARIFDVVTESTHPSLVSPDHSGLSKLKFSPSIRFALLTTLLFLVAVVFMIEGEPNAFIYFQF